MTVQPPDDLELAFLRWIDRGLRLEPEVSRWPLDTRGLKYVVPRAWREHIVAELWDCVDILPDAYCDPIGIGRGSTYGEAVRRVWHDHLEKEAKPMP